MSTFAFARAVLVVTVSVAACSTAPSPERLYAEAEALRQKHEQKATSTAAEKYETAIERWTSRGHMREAATAAQQLGTTYQQLGLLSRSIDAYRKALSLAAATSDLVLQSDIGSDLGSAESMVAGGAEAFERAKHLCDRALALATGAAASPQIAHAMQCLGDVAYQQQAGEEALFRYREAARVLERVDDDRARAQNLLLIGQVSSDLGRFDDAMSSYGRAGGIWSALGDARQQAITSTSIAKLHARRGQNHEALTRFDTALEQLRPMGDAVWEGSTLAGIAEVQLAMGDTASALHHWERALQIFDGAGLQNASIDILMSLGENDLARGDDVQALLRFERALAHAESLGIARWKAYALRYIGIVHLFRRQAVEARQYFERSIQVQKQLGGSAGYRLEAQTLNDLGEAQRMLGSRATAMHYLNRSLALSRAAGDRLTQTTTLYTIARTHLDLGELGAARQRIEEALDVAESLRSDVLHRDLRATYVASIYRWYALHVEVLMRLRAAGGGPAFARAAFEASERARARSLLDGLADTELDLRRGVDPSLLAREQTLLDGLAAWAARQTPGAGANEAAAQAQEYKDLEYRFNQIEAEVRRTSPAHAASNRRTPITLGEIQELLDRDTVLLEYFLGDERSYLWVVSRQGITTHQLPPRSRIEPVAERVYGLLTARLEVAAAPAGRDAAIAKADAEYWREAARLSDLLLKPIGPLRAGRRMLIVADGALHYLPFAALPMPEEGKPPVPLAVHHEVVHVPSASALRALRQMAGPARDRQKTLAVLADPVFEQNDPRLPVRPAVQREDWRIGRQARANVARLVATRQEAEAIVRTAGAKGSLKALDFDASRATAISPELASYRIVHFATHSLFDNTNPGASGILLSQYDRAGVKQDGFLRLHDIYRLKLPVDLVVLSACNTALGRPIKGEGLVGIVRGFMQAGARRVVASHWKVDDEATGELMRRFYVEMLQHHRAPSAALREAQLSMRRLDRWQAPFYWAAFVVQGDWK